MLPRLPYLEKTKPFFRNPFSVSRAGLLVPQTSASSLLDRNRCDFRNHVLYLFGSASCRAKPATSCTPNTLTYRFIAAPLPPAPSPAPLPVYSSRYPPPPPLPPSHSKHFRDVAIRNKEISIFFTVQIPSNEKTQFRIGVPLDRVVFHISHLYSDVRTTRDQRPSTILLSSPYPPVISTSYTGADHVCRDRMEKGRLFSNASALGMEWKARAAAEHQWRRLLDERHRLEMAATRSAAEEGARLDAKVKCGWRARYLFFFSLGGR